MVAGRPLIDQHDRGKSGWKSRDGKLRVEREPDRTSPVHGGHASQGRLDVQHSVRRYELDSVTGTVRAVYYNIVFKQSARDVANQLAAGYGEHFAARFAFVHAFRHLDSGLPFLPSVTTL